MKKKNTIARVAEEDDLPIKDSESKNLVRLIKAKFEITSVLQKDSTWNSLYSWFLDELSRLMDTITGHLPIETSKKQEILEMIDLNSRAEKFCFYWVSTWCGDVEKVRIE